MAASADWLPHLIWRSTPTAPLASESKPTLIKMIAISSSGMVNPARTRGADSVAASCLTARTFAR